MKISYRPEIDGLRAISVFAVIFYHSEFYFFDHQLFKGGFLGVDIFFFISGYLITALLLKEIYTTKKLSIKEFYIRRARRILPALLFVIFFSLLFAYLILQNIPYVDFHKSIISSIFFYSNFLYHYSGNPYFTDATQLNPFLHTWSLSIEEQFYILFPFYLLIIFKYFKRYLLKILFFSFLISIIFAEYISNKHTSFNFYLLPSRGFELLLGSILFCLEGKKKLINISKSCKILNKISPTIGLFLIICSLIFVNGKIITTPSFYTLIPLTGACLILWYSNKNEIVTKILSNNIFVFFGLISYSLYLFHHPIINFSKIIYLTKESVLIKILLILLTIMLSIFSYYFIEKKFRNKKNTSLNKLFIFFIPSIIFITLFSLYIINNGIKNRLPEIFQTNNLNKELTLLNKNINSQNVVLIGDSHAEFIKNVLHKKLNKMNYNFFYFDTRFYINNFNYINIYSKKKDENFVQRNNEINKFIKENSNLIVILHFRWSLRLLSELFNNEEGYAEYNHVSNKFYDYLVPDNIIVPLKKEEREELIKKALISEIRNILTNGHKIILVYPVPEIAFEPSRIIYKKYLFNKLFSKNSNNIEIISTSYEVYKKRNEKIFKILDEIEEPNIYRVYPHKNFCNKQIKDRCIINDNKEIFYFDNNHVSSPGANLITHDIIQAIKVLKKNIF